MIIVEKAKKNHSSDLVIFQIAMALETEELILDPKIVERGVEAVFDDESKGTYYIAIVDGKTVGSFLTTYEWSDWRNGQVVWIQSVYIKPEYRGKGIFKVMYKHILKMVHNNTYLGIRLYVDKNNQKAKKVYDTMGMDNSHYEMYEWMK